ncbi:hypothetical protein LMG2828_04732 [Achromobacter piechaudii]|nr:hypothetical protein LMG2828_04732 [Achromobacter piechaudii]
MPVTATYAIWGLCALYVIALIGDEIAARRRRKV